MRRVSLALLVALELLPVRALAVGGASCKDQILDWGSRVLENGYWDSDGAAGCQPRISLDQYLLARVALEGGGNLGLAGSKRTPRAEPCLGVANADAYRVLIRKTKELASARGLKAPTFALEDRTDVVQIEALIRGVANRTFDHRCALLAEDQMPEVIAELQAHTPAYGWNWADGGADYATSRANCSDGQGGLVKCELRDLLDAACTYGGGTNCSTFHERVIYYIARDVGALRKMWATAVLVDLTQPQCRQFQADKVALNLETAAFDVTTLNHKLHQYRWKDSYTTPPLISLSSYKSQSAIAHRGTAAANWIAEQLNPENDSKLLDTPWSSVPIGTARNFQDLTSPWSADSAAGYGYGPYVSGLSALGSQFVTRAIPYLFLTNDLILQWDGDFDDPKTAADEETSLRALHSAATHLLIDRRGVSEAQRAAGYARYPGRYTPMNSAKGQRPRIADPCSPLGFSNAFTPFVVPRILVANPGGSPELQVGEDGTTTGTWTGKVWCDCPGATYAVDPDTACGVPQHAIGATADGKRANVKACAATLAQPGPHRVVFEVSQAGETEHTLADVSASVAPTFTP